MKISRAIFRQEAVHYQAVSGLFKKVRSPVRSRFGEARSSKATAIFTRGAYWQYVSMEKWRERRWRFFSTGP